MATAATKNDMIVIKLMEKIESDLKNFSPEHIKVQVDKEVDILLNEIAAGKISIPVTYENPSPILKRYIHDSIFQAMIETRLDYQPRFIPLLKANHFSKWMLNIYLGNYTEFMKMINNMSKEELNQHLNMRETAMQFSAVFHVVVGAMDCIPGSHDYFINKTVHGTVESNHLKILVKLLELGADVNATDITGIEPLLFCSTYNPNGQEVASAMAKLLIDKGASINLEGQVLMQLFITSNQEETVKHMIKRGANPYIKYKEGVNAFDFAAGSDNPKLMTYLFKFDKREILNQQGIAIKEGNYKKCGVCRSISSKRCAGCQMEWYCSVDCQKQHWVEHGSICQERQAQYLPVRYVPDKFSSADASSNVDAVVAIQLFSISGMIMRVYDEKFRICGDLDLKRSNNGAKLMEIVKKDGFKGFKGFFNAKKEGKQIRIHPQILPPQLW